MYPEAKGVHVGKALGWIETSMNSSVPRCLSNLRIGRWRGWLFRREAQVVRVLQNTPKYDV
jgi:hypothetical protein